jgi:trans-aconitate methyltransferase
MTIDEWDLIASTRKSGDSLLFDTLYSGVAKAIQERCTSTSLIDYGCGCGDFCQLMAQLGYTTQGFDRSQESITIASEKYQSLPFYTDVEQLHRADIMCSNLVLCTLTNEEQIEAFREMKRLTTELYVISICHPCFDIDSQGVVSQREVPKNARYEDTFQYSKRLRDNLVMHDYHRPLSHYFSLFDKVGLQVTNLAESNTLDSGYKPDFITFVLEERT